MPYLFYPLMHPTRKQPVRDLREQSMEVSLTGLRQGMMLGICSVLEENVGKKEKQTLPHI